MFRRSECSEHKVGIKMVHLQCKRSAHHHKKCKHISQISQKRGNIIEDKRWLCCFLHQKIYLRTFCWKFKNSRTSTSRANDFLVHTSYGYEVDVDSKHILTVSCHKYTITTKKYVMSWCVLPPSAGLVWPVPLLLGIPFNFLFKYLSLTYMF
jgi:hypothetical protein